MEDNVLYCSHCGISIDTNTEDYYTYDGDIYCEDCYSNNFTRCDDCGKVIPIEDSTYIEYDERTVCQDCLENNYIICNDCGEIIPPTNAYTGADGCVYCESCFDRYFTYCDECNRVIWQDDAYWDEDGEQTLCGYCYNNRQLRTILPYHSEYAEYIPMYMSDEDRNNNYNQLYGIELEITGSTDTAERFKELMDDDVVLMHDGSVDGYEMVSMPVSREYFYKMFVPKLKNGLKYLIDNGMTGHNGGGIHVHFKKLDNSIQMANMIKILYESTEFEKDYIWIPITQRKRSSLRQWASLWNNDYGSDEIDESTMGGGINYHSTAFNYDTRTQTNELRIFNSNLRIERIIKNLECVFALEDYIKSKDTVTCDTKGFLIWIDEHADKYKELNNFLHELKIFERAEFYYGIQFKSGIITTVLENELELEEA